MNGKKYVYRLLKSLYGAKRSGKFWNDEIHSTLISLGLKQSEQIAACTTCIRPTPSS